MAAFFVYDDKTRARFDLSTQKQLSRLANKHGTVEVCEIKSDSEWCVRIVFSPEQADPLRLAAIAPSPYEAAVRLWRMVELPSFGQGDSLPRDS